MPLRFTMSDLRTRCQRRVDMESDASISTTEWNSLISEVYAESVYAVVANTGLRYFETSTTYTTGGTSNAVTEPVDQLAFVDTIERIVDTTTGRTQRLRMLAPQERSRWSGRTGHARRWELVDDQILLYPTPPSGDQYILRYIQQPPDLTSYGDSDIVDVVTPDGLGALIWGVAILALSKSKSDVTLALRERDARVDKLEEWAGVRARNVSPRFLVQEEDSYYDDPDFDSWWYDR